jgi:hypothetical protein
MVLERLECLLRLFGWGDKEFLEGYWRNIGKARRLIDIYHELYLACKANQYKSKKNLADTIEKIYIRRIWKERIVPKACYLKDWWEESSCWEEGQERTG